MKGSKAMRIHISILYGALFAFSLTATTIAQEKPILKANGEVLFAQDISANMPASTVNNPHIPLGLATQFDIEYKGAMRPLAKGESSSSYAVGTLGFNPNHNSLYMTGHSQHNAVAEFKIPATLPITNIVKDLPVMEVLQPYKRVLERASRGNKTNKTTGMLVVDDKLLVTSEIWYDGGGSNKDNLQVFDANNLAKAPKGMLQLKGGALIAGYMAPIPSRLSERFGGDYLVGWASNYSITSRYSQGPSLAVFNPYDAINGDTVEINTQIKQVYRHGKKTEMVKGGAEYKRNISPVWAPNAKGLYGFIVPNTDIFMVVGKHGGINTGIGYKITQDNGNICGGQCPYGADDLYNYFWLFNVNDILSAENPSDPRPFSYGKWSMPFKGALIGAVADLSRDMLYITIKDAGRIGEYDFTPLILAYSIKAKQH
jgi:hypothetical protein